MDEEYVRTIGSHKKSDFEQGWGGYVDHYTNKAKELGYPGDLKFKVEKGRVIILAVI